MIAPSRVAPDQRFTRRNPCPICRGFDSMRRQQSMRCYGFLSDDERVAHCTREDLAGELPESPTSRTYAHRLDGSCRCGRAHDGLAPLLLDHDLPHQRRHEQTAPQPRREPVPRALADGATLTEEYAYRQADGALAYRVLRYNYPLQPGETKPQKTFRQVRQLDTSSWEWGLGDTERVLYRLPEMLSAPHQRPVFVVEGEKCANAVAGLGLVATTCSEGAGKWRQVPGRHDALSGRHVVILPDNDDPGRAHAGAIAEDLAGVAASVRIVVLPDLAPRGDVVDWIAASGTALALLEMVIATPIQQLASDSAPAQDSCPGPQDASRETSTPTAAALKVAETTVYNLRARDAWDSKLRANSQVRTSYKPTLSLIMDEWQRVARADPHKPMRVYRQAWAERLGISEDAVSRHLAQLDRSGTIKRHYEYTYDEHGLRQTHLAIVPTETLLQQPDAIVMTGWGGKRDGAGRRCKTCQSENLEMRRQIVCRECGAIETLPTIEVNVSAPATEDDTSPSQNSCPEPQLDFREDIVDIEPNDGPPDGSGAQVQHTHQAPSAYETGGKTALWETDAPDTCERSLADVRAGDPPDRPDRCVDGHAHRWIIGECLVCHAKKAG